ncbi:MAG: serine/threonine-protein kinase RsbW [Saprospiraceae bacterium]|jgi:serine/threonine-protein kinase RsbW
MSTLTPSKNNSDRMQEKLSFSSKVENINLVEKLIDDICDKHKVNEDNYGNILIAITEAVNNAIHHGNKSNPLAEVKVSFSTNDKELTFVVEDEGAGFDFDSLPDPTDPKNIEKPHGRGVFLMRNLSDDITFLNEGSSVKMVFDIT